MKNWKTLLIGALIPVGAIAVYVQVSEPDTLGERFDEATEEVGDEIDDNT